MYSRNDYRYYLEHRAVQSDDFLMHYGVKGMKWRHHKFKKPDVGFDRSDLGTYVEFNRERDKNGNVVWADRIGVRKKGNKITAFNTTNDKYWKDGQVSYTKQHGRVTKSYAEDGSATTIDLGKRKKKSNKKKPETYKEKRDRQNRSIFNVARKRIRKVAW